MILIDFTNISLKLKEENNKVYVFDVFRKKWLILTPEEHVRQYVSAYLISALKYPSALIAAEKKIMVGKMNKRFDLVVYNRYHQPWMLIECKSPEVNITEKALHQLLNYQRVIQSRYWVISNGQQTFCADAKDNLNITWLRELPAYEF